MNIRITLNGRQIMYRGIGGEQGTGNQRWAYTQREWYMQGRPKLKFWATREGDNRRELHVLYVADGITNVEALYRD